LQFLHSSALNRNSQKDLEEKMADVVIPRSEDKASIVPSQAPVLTTEGEYKEVKQRVSKWGSGILGISIVILILLVVIVVMVSIVTAKVDPIPDQTLRAFEWSPNEGGPWNSMKSGNMMFALWADGNAYIVNTQSGALVPDSPTAPTNSSQFSEGKGGYMTLNDGELTLYAFGTNNAIARASASAQNATGFTLNLLPTGNLFWKSSSGLISQFVWEKAL
jgi:hypothetical protein